MRRRIVRFSRRFGGQRVAPAPSPGYTIPLAGEWAAGAGAVWYAEDGPVDVGSGAVDPWTPVEGTATFDQSSSSDRGMYDTTTFSGGRGSVVFNGSTDFMHCAGVALMANGASAPFTQAWHLKIITLADNRVVTGWSDSNTINSLMRLGYRTTPSWRPLRKGASADTVEQNAGTPATGDEYIIVMSYNHTLNQVTLWVNGVKILNGASLSTTNLAANRYIMAAQETGAGVGNHAAIAMRWHAVKNTVTNDAGAAEIFAAWNDGGL